MHVSVVMSTYNRCALLDKAIHSLLQQKTNGLDYEIIVVDNNSTDATSEKLNDYVRTYPRLRYVFEERQGVAYGRNAGIQVARGEFIAFCDDDVVVAEDWVQRIYEGLLRYPDADFVGGKVLPSYDGPVPRWVSWDLSPFAMQILGDKPIVVSSDFPHCLISACLGIRRRALERAGLFDTATQRVKDGIGSTEDYDWENKIWQNGGHGVYLPDIVCYAEVPAQRLVKSYHRRWHWGHGKFNAIGRRAEFDGSRRILDVPLFMYRQTVQTACEWVMQLVQGKTRLAFERENRLFFYLGFIAERWKAQLLSRPPGRTGEPQSAAS